MVFTERGELQSASRSFRESFLRDWKWSLVEDTCVDIYTPDVAKYEWPKDLKCAQGDLPEYYHEQAVRYIRTATRRYPFQMRYYFGEPMWARFCDVWASTGDLKKAMRAI